jgi:predicted dinucleotide-binding enzyme
LVLQLANELGFDGVDDGGLDDSWRQQPGTPVYDKELDSADVRHALAEARKERLPQWPATGSSPGSLAQRA